MPTFKRNFGDFGEKAAANYLKERGYSIIDLNFKNNFGRTIGELDIIARDPKSREIVFVEVKTREFERYYNSLPEENITPAKLKKMEKIANVFLRKNRLENSFFRFDAISVWLDKDSKMAKIKHISHL